VAFALAVGGLGLGSYARQSRWLSAVLVLPAALLGAAMVASGHNLWPRLFFASAGFALLIAVRGCASAAGLVARLGLEGRKRGVLTAALLLACAASAATVSRAYGPKQDFAGAREHVLARMAPGDDVVALDMAVLPFEALYGPVPFGPAWKTADNLPDLLEIERNHPRTWVITTTPTRLQAALPDVWEHLERHYGVSGTFHGSVHGGEVEVLVTPTNDALESPRARRIP
jgi:hypothetical protein